MNLKTITTRLENASREEISIILNEKALISANGMVDYVGFAIDNIDSANARIDDYIKELQAIKKQNTARIETIKAGVSEWLTDNGVSKLNGDLVSSITVYDKKESYEVVITNEEAVINAGFYKMVVDKTLVKNAIMGGVAIEGAHLDVVYSEQSIKINRKRIKQDELAF